REASETGTSHVITCTGGWAGRCRCNRAPAWHGPPSSVTIAGARHVTHSVAHPAPAEYVDMEVKDQLAPIGPVVGHKTITFGFQAEFLRDAADGAPESVDQRIRRAGGEISI